MTKNKLKTSFIFRVVIAVLITATIILLPAAVFAESEGAADGGSTASEGFEAGGSDFGAESESASGFGGEPTAGLSTIETSVDNTATSPEVPAPETDVPPASPPSDQPSSNLSDPEDTGAEKGDVDGAAVGNAESGAGSSADHQGTLPTEAAGSDADSGILLESGASNQAQYFQIAGNSMNPLLQPGSMVEIFSETYADGDMVVAQTADGIYIIKTVSGDRLVSEGTGLSFALTDVTILGAATYSSMTAAEFELAGFSWTSVLAVGYGVEPTLVGGFYQIATWQNLCWISEASSRWGYNYIQTADIVFPLVGDDRITGWNVNTGWTPIGNSTTKFTGSYNGQGHTVSNLFINRVSSTQGLFGYASGATLNNIALVNVNVTGTEFFGGLVGYNESGSISNSSATGAVTGTGYVGGLVGYSYNGTISKSYATGAVTGTGNYVGGLVGSNESGPISNSSATGAVTGSGYVGGLVGNNYEGPISYSSASGTVTGTGDYGDFVGGLVGMLVQSSIYDSYSSSSVEGNGNRIGGLIGYADYICEIKNSYATGNVKGINEVGGLLGVASDGGPSPFVTVENCYATGNVEGNNNVGGLVGRAESAVIKNSFAAGNVNCAIVGRLIGDNDHSTINNSYAVLQGSYPLVGSGSAIGADNTTLAAMKNIQTYLDAGWTIVPFDPNNAPTEGWFIRANSFPQLFWEHPGPQPSSGGGDFGFVDFGFTFIFPPALATGGALTNIPGQAANAIITPAFVTGGSAADLGRAIAAYNQAKQSYEANKGTMCAADKAVAKVELAVANAAIMALELRLAAENGQAVDVAALVAAYQAALAALNSNRGLLTTQQIAAAEALLNAIASVISRFST